MTLAVIVGAAIMAAVIAVGVVLARRHTKAAATRDAADARTIDTLVDMLWEHLAVGPPDAETEPFAIEMITLFDTTADDRYHGDRRRRARAYIATRVQAGWILERHRLITPAGPQLRLINAMREVLAPRRDNDKDANQ